MTRTVSIGLSSIHMFGRQKQFFMFFAGAYRGFGQGVGGGDECYFVHLWAKYLLSGGVGEFRSEG